MREIEFLVKATPFLTKHWFKLMEYFIVTVTIGTAALKLHSFWLYLFTFISIALMSSNLVFTTMNAYTDFFREKYGKEFTIKKWVINSLVGSSLLSLLFFCVKTISLIAAEIIDKGIMQ